jgi:hypothetical protein
MRRNTRRKARREGRVGFAVGGSGGELAVHDGVVSGVAARGCAEIATRTQRRGSPVDTGAMSDLDLATLVELVRLTLAADPAAATRLAALQAAAVDPAVHAPHRTLAARLGLGDGEVRAVWLLAAIAVDPDVRRQVGGLPTLDTLRRLAYGAVPSRAAVRGLGADAPLRALHVIERADAGDVHDHLQTWALAPRVLALLLGETGLDPALAGACRIPTAAPPLDALALADDAAARATAAIRRGGAVVVAVGAPGLGRRSLLVAAAASVGRGVLEVDARRLATGAALAGQLGRIARECRLLERVPLVVGADALSAEASDAFGDILVGRGGDTALATASTGWTSRWPLPVVRVELAAPSPGPCAALWSRALAVSAVRGDTLARRHRLAPAVIGRVAATARASTGADVGDAELRDAVRAVADAALGPLARRQASAHALVDLVLPRDHADAVGELVARVRARDRVLDDWGLGKRLGATGVAALFSGPPGTGKSMCAAAIANELGVDLYVVDASRIASKWIGETEQHLAALFDAAAASHAMLLFDEADALFGKRTEQRSSNDRHANAETNYLLHRLERHDAPCIVTTNHAANLDPAFLRRFALHLRFALPGADDRAALWRAMLPDTAPVGDDVDVAALARRFELAGGHIKNAVLRAAFVAADRGVAIGQALLERAARVEYEAIGRIATS